MRKFALHEIGSGIERAYRLIVCSALGRRTLDQFLPLVSRGQVDLRVLDERNQKEIAAGNLLQGDPAGAFYFDGVRRVIFLEPGLETGLLAPLLFHEMIHCLDEDYLKSFLQNEKNWLELRTRAKAIVGLDVATLTQSHLAEIVELKREAEGFDHQRLFKTERKAHSATYWLVQEFIDSIEGYRFYISRQKKNGFELDRWVSEAELIRKYGLNPETLEGCRTSSPSLPEWVA
ncbi:hypothetical protein WDW86_13180 [Bdellovibrionota bacterium FG-2]